MSKKHKRSLAFKIQAGSSNASRAEIVTGSSVGEPRVDSRARWNSAPFDLERVDTRRDATRVKPKHPRLLMGLVAGDHSCKLIIDLEIRRRSTFPKVEAFVRRADLAYPMELPSELLRTGQQGTMA
jgi:hypothetical protein